MSNKQSLLTFEISITWFSMDYINAIYIFRGAYRYATDIGARSQDEALQ